MIKYCPYLISHETVKEMLIVTGDWSALYSCVGNKCVAYKAGKCMKYDITVATKKGNSENE